MTPTPLTPTDNRPLSGKALQTAVEAQPEGPTVNDYKLFHVDDCMYVAASTREEAAAYVRRECGEQCGDLEWVHETSLDMPVTRANVDDGEEATPETMTTAGAMVKEHLAAGGTLPYTVCFDGGM